MDTNPLVLFFLGLGVFFTFLIIVLAILQRKLLEQQKRAVDELLAEAREMRLSGAEPEEDDSDEGAA